MNPTLKAGQQLVEAELNHHGVLGMKWGVRKDRPGSAGGGKVRRGGRAVKTVAKDIGFELNTSSDSNRRQIAQNATSRFEKDIPKLNAKHGASAELKNRIKRPLSKESIAYRKEARDLYLKHLETSANEQVNASRTRQRTLTTTAPGIERTGKFHFQIVERTHPNTKKYLWEVRTRDIHHADDPWMTLEPIFDDNGFITTCKPANTSMTQSSLVEVGKNFLTHHGVLGMKWGFRKTSEVPSPRAADATSIVPHDKLGKTKIQTKGGENHPAHQDAVRVALAQQKLSKSGVHALSNKELQDVASRMNLEGQVHALNSKRPKSLGQRFIAEQANQAQKDPAAYLEKVNKGVEAVRKLKKAAA